MAELLIEKSERIATLTLNRPERLNAISGPMLEALSEALLDCDRNGTNALRGMAFRRS